MFYSMAKCWIYPVLLLLWAQAGRAGKAPPCEDLDSQACVLFQAKMPGLCQDAGLSTTCKRFCGLCPLVCHDCPTAVNKSMDCPDTKACAADELCMLKEHSITGVGAEFIMTCEKKATCEGLNTGFHLIGKRGEAEAGSRDEGGSRDQRDLNFHCCNTDLCNYPAAFTTLPPTTHRPIVHQSTVPTTTVHVTPLHNCSKDIVFMMDGSSTIGYNNHNYMKQFVELVMRHLHIGSRDNLVAMVEYSNTARVEWYLTDHTSQRDLLHAASQVPFVMGSTATHAGFWLIRNTVLTAKHGDRSNAKDVVVLITDGGTDVPDLALNEANALRAAGVDIIVVAVGHNANANFLQKLASPTTNYYYVSSVRSLYSIASKIAAALCHIATSNCNGGEKTSVHVYSYGAACKHRVEPPTFRNLVGKLSHMWKIKCP